MGRRAAYFVSFFSFGLITACGDPLSSSSQSSAIIDDDSLLPVGDGSDLPNQELRNSMGAIGRMTGGCTAFHLGEGLVATAGHCLPAPQQGLEAASCAGYAIQWSEGGQHSRCLQYVAYRFDDGADYALIAVDPAPPRAVQLTQQLVSAGRKIKAVVIGFPKDRQLSSSAACQVHWEEASHEPHFYHDCDTLPGHSGSPVFDLETANLIGVHDGGAKKQNYGTLLPPASDIQDWIQQLSARPKPDHSFRFGPFANSETRMLTQVPAAWGKRVRFKVETQLEAPYDKLIITDGIGRRTELSGAQERSLDLPAPLVFEVQTDYSGISKGIRIDQLESYDPLP